MSTATNRATRPAPTSNQQPEDHTQLRATNYQMVDRKTTHTHYGDGLHNVKGDWSHHQSSAGRATHYSYVHIHIHIHIHTFMHTYIQYIHTYTHSFIHSFIHSFVHSYLQTYIIHILWGKKLHPC